MIVLNVHYNGMSPKITYCRPAASGQIKTMLAEFVFSEEWADYPKKTAVFISGDIKKKMPLNEESMCDVPPEVIRPGTLLIGVFANGAEEDGEEAVRYAGAYGSMHLMRGATPDDATDTEEDASPYDKLLAHLVVVEGRIEETTQKAKEAASSAKTAAQNAFNASGEATRAASMANASVETMSEWANKNIPKVLEARDDAKKAASGANTAATRANDAAGKVEELLKGGIPQSDWLAEEGEAGHILNRTHYQTVSNAPGYMPYDECDVEALGVGTHLVFKPTNETHFKNTFVYESMRAADPFTYNIDYSCLYPPTGGEISFKYRAEQMVVNTLFTLIDTKNYRLVQFSSGVTAYVILDVNTLAEEYRSKFPEIGIYLDVEESVYTNRKITIQVVRVYRLNELYIPDTIARKSDIPEGGTGGDYIPVPPTASVGQTIRVSAVDENGKPTEWEAVNFPEGGGGESAGKWRLLNDITTKEEIAANTGISLSAADDGTPYNLKEVVFLWSCPAASGSAYATFKVNGRSANGTSPDFFSSGGFFTNADRKALCTIKALGDAAVLKGNAGINGYGAYGDSVNVVYNYAGAFETITSIDFTMFGNVFYPAGLKITIWGLEA